MTYKEMLDKLAELDRRMLLLEDFWLRQPKPQFAPGTLPERNSLFYDNPQDGFK